MLKIWWKRGEIAPEEQFLHLSTIFCYLMLDFYVKRGIRFSLRDKRLFEITEVEITRVDCNYLLHDNSLILYRNIRGHRKDGGKPSSETNSLYCLTFLRKSGTRRRRCHLQGGSCVIFLRHSERGNRGKFSRVFNNSLFLYAFFNNKAQRVFTNEKYMFAIYRGIYSLYLSHS